VTEDELLSAVLDMAALFKWRTLHIRPARTEHGWRSPVQGDGAGFPDLLLLRERLVFAELKSERGSLSVDQQDWMFALGEIDAERYVWRPKDWESGEIEKVLR
jgi:hypothetical protein